MNKMIRGFMAILSILGLSVLAHASTQVKKETGPEIRVETVGNAVDVYLVNRTAEDLFVYPMIRYYGVAHEVEFVFFKDGKKCVSCAYRGDLMETHPVPPAEPQLLLRPGEIMGASLSAQGIAARYGLDVDGGCYSFYAKYKNKSYTKKAFAGSLISNVDRLCIKK